MKYTSIILISATITIHVAPSTILEDGSDPTAHICAQLCEQYSAENRGQGFDLCSFENNRETSRCVENFCTGLYWSIDADIENAASSSSSSAFQPGFIYISPLENVSDEDESVFANPVACSSAFEVVNGDTLQVMRYDYDTTHWDAAIMMLNHLVVHPSSPTTNIPDEYFQNLLSSSNPLRDMYVSEVFRLDLFSQVWDFVVRQANATNTFATMTQISIACGACNESYTLVNSSGFIPVPDVGFRRESVVQQLENVVMDNLQRSQLLNSETSTRHADCSHCHSSISISQQSRMRHVRRLLNISEIVPIFFGGAEWRNIMFHQQFDFSQFPRTTSCSSSSSSSFYYELVGLVHIINRHHLIDIKYQGQWYRHIFNSQSFTRIPFNSHMVFNTVLVAFFKQQQQQHDH